MRDLLRFYEELIDYCSTGCCIHFTTNTKIETPARMATFKLLPKPEATLEGLPNEIWIEICSTTIPDRFSDDPFPPPRHILSRKDLINFRYAHPRRHLQLGDIFLPRLFSSLTFMATPWSLLELLDISRDAILGKYVQELRFGRKVLNENLQDSDFRMESKYEDEDISNLEEEWRKDRITSYKALCDQQATFRRRKCYIVLLQLAIRNLRNLHTIVLETDHVSRISIRKAIRAPPLSPFHHKSLKSFRNNSSQPSRHTRSLFKLLQPKQLGNTSALSSTDSVEWWQKYAAICPTERNMSSCYLSFQTEAWVSIIEVLAHPNTRRLNLEFELDSYEITQLRGKLPRTILLGNILTGIRLLDTVPHGRSLIKDLTLLLTVACNSLKTLEIKWLHPTLLYLPLNCWFLRLRLLSTLHLCSMVKTNAVIFVLLDSSWKSLESISFTELLLVKERGCELDWVSLLVMMLRMPMLRSLKLSRLLQSENIAIRAGLKITPDYDNMSVPEGSTSKDEEATGALVAQPGPLKATTLFFMQEAKTGEIVSRLQTMLENILFEMKASVFDCHKQVLKRCAKRYSALRFNQGVDGRTTLEEGEEKEIEAQGEWLRYSKK
ncbi:hypothetical protein CC80DRAFT_557870 [Byssothecium circinans]|uniref:Uncharacterized protein n=1 Tax=Byssothecium circinans TaxID=147558 RepID=A0A6A5ULP3_9PLEO|nr:hypothetical protein CC80DRAFT_557870 [Byssothecium circinans]